MFHEEEERGHLVRVFSNLIHSFLFYFHSDIKHVCLIMPLIEFPILSENY